MVAMEVTHLNTTWVKPETRLHGEIPLTIFDRASSNLHVAIILVFDAPTASNTKIKIALAKALTYYPVLAGKLSGEPPVVVLDDDAGTPVAEMSAEGSLENFLPLKATPHLALLHPYTEESNPLLMVQLTRFACGGLVLGLSANHVVADGQSISNFIVTWSQLVKEKEVKPVPTHDRSVLVPRDPPMPEHPHQDNMEFSMSPPTDEQPAEIYEGSMANVRVHYSYDFIMKLKERPRTKQSTFECLLSHLWKKVTVARGLDDEVITRARVSVNGRPRLGVPGEYFGNLVLTAFPAAKVKDLVQEDLGYGAKLIKEAVGQMGSEYFQSLVDFGELYKDKVLYPSIGGDGNTLLPNLEVNSWLGFQFHQVDMGGGAPRAFMPSWIPMEGIVIIAPTPPPEKGAGPGDRWRSGVDVTVTLLPEHAATFEKIAYSID